MANPLDLQLQDYARLKDLLPQLEHLISRKTIERRLIEGLVPSATKGPDGHWIVHVPTLRAWVMGEWPPRGSAIGVARVVAPVSKDSAKADSDAAKRFEKRLAALERDGEFGGTEPDVTASLVPSHDVVRHWLRVALRIGREEHGSLQAEG